MSAPSKQLERTRGRILDEAERLRVASTVRPIEVVDDRLAEYLRGRFVLALTERRLLVVSEALRASRIRLLQDWPAERVRISTSRPKVGSGLIHVEVGDRGAMSFERVNGHRARDWAGFRYRR